jgi:hypothetical protein
MIIVTRVNKIHLFLKTVPVPDAPCPLCKARGSMEMSFYQLQLEAGWVRNTKKITASVDCKNCDQDVPVVRWDKALENFFATAKKDIKVETSFKAGGVGKFLIWLAIIFFGAIFLLTAGLFIYHRVVPKQTVSAAEKREAQVHQSAQYAASPQPGDLVLVYLIGEHKQALFKITAVDAAHDLVKAIPSDRPIDVPANAGEVPAADQDFKPGNEKDFWLTDYKDLRYTTPGKDHLGNVQMIYRK